MPGNDNFLSRWSRRKTEASSGLPEEKPAVLAGAGRTAPTPPDEAPAAATPLPSVESLTPESDFSPFMKPEVDEGLKRQALKTLFSDPRFNVMDGLDVYIDDYSKPDPLPESWLGMLNQMARLGHYQEPVKAEEQPPAAEGSGESLREPKDPEKSGVIEAPAGSESDTSAIGERAPEI